MPLDPDRRLAPAFQFRVTLTKSGGAAAGGAQPSNTLGDGGFQECSGLDIEMDVQEYAEGGRNDGIVRRVGRGKYTNIILKRGMFYNDGGKVNRQLWEWLQGILSGVRPVARYNGVIEVLSGDARRAVRATWAFSRGLPAKISGPALRSEERRVGKECRSRWSPYH